MLNYVHPQALIMRKPSAATSLIAASLLLSAWGNVIGACFCLRYSMDHDHRLSQRSHMPLVRQESSCNHEMSDMKMDGVRMDDLEMESQVLSSPARNLTNRMQPTSQDSTDHAVLESPGERCGHCLMYSAPASAGATLVALNPANRLLETEAPLVKLEVTLSPPLSISIIPSEHGPPGNLFPRHILISVFRI